MNKSQKICAVAASMMLLQSCAGRDAKPVSVHNAYDDQLSCLQLKAEILNNEEKAKQLTDENNSSHNRNVAVGVVGAILFWPALFALDLSDAQKQEIDALRQRNNSLSNLESKQCDTLQAQAPPIVIAPTNQASATAYALPPNAQVATFAGTSPARSIEQVTPASVVVPQPASVAVPTYAASGVNNATIPPAVSYIDPVCREYQSRPTELEACMRGRTPPPSTPVLLTPATAISVSAPPAVASQGTSSPAIGAPSRQPLIFVKRVEKGSNSAPAASPVYDASLIEGAKQFCAPYMDRVAEYQKCITAYLGDK